MYMLLVIVLTYQKFIIVFHLAGGASRPTIDQAQLERELELDIEKVRIEDNIDPNVRLWLHSETVPHSIS